MFLNEKKFNLDEPDGMSYHWRDLKFDKNIQFSRQMGGGSVMVWGSFSWYSKSSIAIIRDQQTAKLYCYTLERFLVMLNSTFLQHYHFLQFRHDNAPIYSAQVTQDWLPYSLTPSMTWPVRSLDLNHMENVWACMMRDGYRDGRQYSNVPELKSAVIIGCRNICPNLCRTVVSSMRMRCI